jgi:hypothetical protein
MSIEEIRALKHAKPFRPFELQTKDGRRVVIDQPVRIALSPRGDSIAGYGHDGSFYFGISDIVSAIPRGNRRRPRAS